MNQEREERRGKQTHPIFLLLVDKGGVTFEGSMFAIKPECDCTNNSST